MELATKPDYDQCVERIEAWFQGEILDRVPIRFHRHNAEYNTIHKNQHLTLKDRWFDSEYQVDEFLRSISGMRFNGETFPIYTPNLGPNVYASFHGGEMTFEDTTSWYHRIIHDYESDLVKIKFSKENIYYKKILELTEVALQKCHNKFLVGYTDLHPGLDCALAWRGTNDLCTDLIMDTGNSQKLFDLATENFAAVYDEYDTILKAHNMPSCTWMNIPVHNGRMHIPSADFSFMISPDDYIRYGLPILREEVKTMTHNVFHVDGKGVANHIDAILSVPEVQCIQWVQGIADDFPIIQHLDFIRYVQSRNRGIIVDLAKEDLDVYMEKMLPKNTFLWVAAESEEEEIAIMKKLTKWK
ncbi:MAG: hypothetical protein WCJ95_03930 [Mariniphaga sp.]